MYIQVVCLYSTDKLVMRDRKDCSESSNKREREREGSGGGDSRPSKGRETNKHFLLLISDHRSVSFPCGGVYPQKIADLANCYGTSRRSSRLILAHVQL